MLPSVAKHSVHGCTVRYINAIHAVQHLGNLCLHLLSHSWFFPNLHLIVIQSLNLWQSQLPVSCFKCPINSEVSTAFQFWVNLRYVRDRRRATIHRPNTSVLWLLGGKPVIMRARCWCFALCKDSGVTVCNVCSLAITLIVLVQVWKIPCSRNNHCISIKPPSTKWHKRRPRVIYSCGWVNF